MNGKGLARYKVFNKMHKGQMNFFNLKQPKIHISQCFFNLNTDKQRACEETCFLTHISKFALAKGKYLLSNKINSYFCLTSNIFLAKTESLISFFSQIFKKQDYINMYFQDLLRQRRSTRRFTSQTIEQDKIERLQKAALMSPAGKSKNEWEFISIQDKETLQALSTCKEHGSELIEKSTLAFVVLADTSKSDVWIEDCSIASIILQLQAEALGLGSCWVQCRLRKQKNGTPTEDFVRQLLNIPSHYAVLSIIAFGYKAENKKPFEEGNLQWEKFHSEKF